MRDVKSRFFMEIRLLFYDKNVHIIIEEVFAMKRISIMMYLGIAMFALLGLFFCGFYVPKTFGLFSQLSSSLEYVEMAFYWTCSIPCFCFLILFIKIAKSVSEESFFTSTTVKNLKISGYLLAVDSMVFFVANVVFAIIRQSLSIETLMAILSLVGVAIGVSGVFISQAVEQSRQYKEYSEGIL